MLDLDVGTQLRIWGYFISGEICEKSAIISEGKDVEAIVWNAWDYGIEWLAKQMVSHGDEDYHMPPEYWCLPGVTELRIHREKEYWDLIRRTTT